MTNLYRPIFTHAKGYFEFSNCLKTCDINNFKQSEDLIYMTEHIGDIHQTYGQYFYEEIIKYNMLDNSFISELIKLNDSYGNPKKFFIHNDIENCSPNTLKYIYFGLKNIIYIQEHNLNNFDFIEIGGGYGGQCVILLKLLDYFKIKINRYLLIDLEDVVLFQSKYINTIIPENKIEILKFIDSTSLTNYSFSFNSYLFSSYSLSELNTDIKKIYYDNLFEYIKYGFFVWNIQEINIPKKYFFEKHIIDDIGTFVYLDTN